MKIAIIDYGAGNVQSVQFALQRLGYKADLTSDSDAIRKADRVIFPGVGQAYSAMSKLKDSGLDQLIPELDQPFLGICLGMQLMCSWSEEGDTDCLNLFDDRVLRFDQGHKVPQIGWNQIFSMKTSLFDGVEEGSHVYLVHSYYAPLVEATIASSDYGLAYSTALHKDNFYGVQFHPEKSGPVGSRILQNFLEKCG